jgi:hypothetical protein
VPRGWWVRHHLLLFSLSFLFVALVVQFVVRFYRFLSFFLLFTFLVVPWSLNHYVNTLPTNKIENQQLLDLSKISLILNIYRYIATLQLILRYINTLQLQFMKGEMSGTEFCVQKD